MLVNVNSFRENFPEFRDTDVYTDARLSFWLNYAEKYTESNRWKASGFRLEGLQLLAAHYLTMEHDALSGSGTGAASGPLTGQSQSADGLSFSESYDCSAYAGLGQLAATSYGRLFLDLARLVGMGGVQL